MKRALATVIAALISPAVAHAHGPSSEGYLRRVAGPCLSEIIERETAHTWSHHIYNYQGSGAYGLPQALPGSKMRSAGRDWRSNPLTQIRWMRSYARTRYGSECGAWARWQERQRASGIGWY